MSTETAGPELDLLIAERVLGWEGCHIEDKCAWGIPPDEAKHAFEHKRNAVVFECDLFSAEILDAWAVVVAMEAKGLTLLLDGREKWPDGSGRALWRASFWRGTNMAGTSNDTAPLAICRAALAALEAAL